MLTVLKIGVLFP